MLFIHEYPDWTQFRYNSKLVTKVLGETRLKQGRLLGSMEALNSDLIKTANSAVIKKEIESSFKIDNRFQEIQEQIPSNIIETYTSSLHNFNVPLTEDTLFKIQQNVCQMPSKKWRQDPMLITSQSNDGSFYNYKSIAPERISQEMNLFFLWFNDPSKDQVLVAALAHFRLVTIHPFPRGNGRVARLISDIALAKSEDSSNRYYSMSSAILNDKEKYMEILRRTQAGDGDLTEWLLWFTQTLQNAVSESLHVYQKILKQSQFWNAHSHVLFNDRQKYMLHLLLDNSNEKLTTSYWAKINQCSADTALRDIQDLLSKNILEKESSKGRSTSYRIKK